MSHKTVNRRNLKATLRSLLWDLLTKLPTVAVVALIVLALEHFGVLNGLQTVTLDTWLLATAGGPSSEIFIVGIDDDDYEQYFDGRSPLAPERLRTILDAIVAAHPKTIGVDIDTSNSMFKNLMHESADLSAAVWARDCRKIEKSESAHAFEREDFLGGSFTELPPTDDMIATDPKSGATVFPQDSDGLVRRYYPAIVTHSRSRDQGSPGLCLSMSMALAGESAGGKGAEEPRLLNTVTAKMQRMYVHQLLQAAQSSSWSSHSPLAGKIVLLGGMYHAARDSYLTALGPRFGVELIAQAVATELSGGGIQELSAVSQFALDLVLGAALIIFSHFFSGRLAFFMNLLGIAVLAIIGSWIAFRSLAYWFNYGAVLAGLFIHMQYEHTVERHELRQEVEELRKKLAAQSK
ncbi:MAG TPA: CHASE2 domain-containing protein [Pirellulales bacterium]